MEHLFHQYVTDELQAMHKVDQEARFNPDTSEEEIRQIDLRHIARLKEIIEEIGWPTISKVGVIGSHHAWLLAQHADHDRPFQENVLELMLAQPEGEVLKRGIAYLTDRLLVGKNLPQRYGTQFRPIFDEEGNFVKCALREVEDPQNLEIRRMQMEMETFGENLREFARRNNFVMEEIDLGNYREYYIG